MSFGGGTVTGEVTAATFTLPSGPTVGEFVLVQIWAEPDTSYLNGISGGGVTWDSTPVVAHTSYATPNGTATVWKGEVTTAGGGTVTLTFNGTETTVRGNYTVFSTTAGYPSVTLDVSGSVNGATSPPSLTPSHGAGELYYGWQYNSNSGTAGTTSGYTYYVDANANVAMWDTDCTSSTQSPAIGGGNDIYGLAVLLYEAQAGATLVTAKAGVSVSATATTDVTLQQPSVTETAYVPQVFTGVIVPLVKAQSSVTAHTVSPVYGNRTQLMSASADISPHLPSVYVAPNVSVLLDTAVVNIGVTPIGYTPPVEVYLQTAYVGIGATRVGPPNLPVMTMTYQSNYDNFGNYIPKGFNLYGTQADQLLLSQDIYYISQVVHGQTVDVYLPTISFSTSQEYTTRTYSPGAIYATPANVGESSEYTYTQYVSGFLNSSSGASLDAAGMSLNSETYSGSSGATIQFRSGTSQVVTVAGDGLHTTSGARLNMTGYQQSPNTVTQPGLVGEISNQGTSNEFTSMFISGGNTSNAGENYMYLQSQSSSGATTPVTEFVMNGAVVGAITPSSTTFWTSVTATGALSGSQLLLNGASGSSTLEVNGSAHISGATELDDLSVLNGQSLPLGTVSTVTTAPGSTYTSTTETVITDLESAVNGLISRLQSIGILP